jgi:O-antigen/teichoic acid export membrane protein
MGAEPVQRSARQRATSGTIWTLLGYGAGRLARLGSQLFLAHLLAPEAFGLWAIVAAILAGLQMFSDVGIGPSIIQNERGDEREFLNTAFAIQVSRGLLLGLLCLLAGYPIARFYELPALAPLMWVAALSPLIAGLTSTAVWTMVRHVEVRKVAILHLVSDVTGAGLAILWAYLSPSVWAFIAGNLATAVVLTLGSHSLLPEKNRLQWRGDYARSMLRFGRGILLSTATAFLAAETERLVLGKYVSLATLGVMSIVILCTNTAMGAISQLMNRVVLPVISESLRQNSATANLRFSRTRILMLLASVLIAVAFLLGGEMIFSILLDERYADAGWMFEIIAIRVVVGANVSPMGTLLLAGGYTGYAAVGNTLRFLLILSGIILGASYFDLGFVCWVLALAGLPDYAVRLYGVKRHFSWAFGIEVRCAAATIALIALCTWLS